MQSLGYESQGADLPAWSLWGFAAASLGYVLVVALLHATGRVPVAASAVGVVLAVSPLMFFAMLFLILGLEAGQTGGPMEGLTRELDTGDLLQPRVGVFALYAAFVTGALASLVGAAPTTLTGDRGRWLLTSAVYAAALLLGIAVSLAGRRAPVRV